MNVFEIIIGSLETKKIKGIIIEFSFKRNFGIDGLISLKIYIVGIL